MHHEVVAIIVGGYKEPVCFDGGDDLMSPIKSLAATCSVDGRCTVDLKSTKFVALPTDRRRTLRIFNR